MKPDASQDIGFYITGWILILGCVSYLLFMEITKSNPLDQLPGCAFHLLTGFYCPGCGGTRAVFAFVHGHLIRSFLYHPLVLYVAIVGGWFMVSQSVERLSRGRLRIAMHFRPIYLWISLVIIIVQFIVKNIILYNGYDILNTLGTTLG